MQSRALFAHFHFEITLLNLEWMNVILTKSIFLIIMFIKLIDAAKKNAKPRKRRRICVCDTPVDAR